MYLPVAICHQKSWSHRFILRNCKKKIRIRQRKIIGLILDIKFILGQAIPGPELIKIKY